MGEDKKNPFSAWSHQNSVSWYLVSYCRRSQEIFCFAVISFSRAWTSSPDLIILPLTITFLTIFTMFRLTRWTHLTQTSHCDRETFTPTWFSPSQSRSFIMTIVLQIIMNHDYCCLASIMISPPLQLVSAAEAIEKLSAAAAAGLNQDTIEDFTDPVKFIMLTVQNLTSISIIIFAKRCETSLTAQCEKQLRKTKTSGDRFLLPSMFSSSSSSLYSRWFSCNKQWMSVIDVSAPLRVFLSGECRPFLSWIQKIQQLMWAIIMKVMSIVQRPCQLNQCVQLKL